MPVFSVAVGCCPRHLLAILPRRWSSRQRPVKNEAPALAWEPVSTIIAHTVHESEQRLEVL